MRNIHGNPDFSRSSIDMISTGKLHVRYCDTVFGSDPENLDQRESGLTDHLGNEIAVFLHLGRLKHICPIEWGGI